MNKTHHIHKYEKAIDSQKLMPLFRQDEWQIFESPKLKFRAGTIILPDLDINAESKLTTILKLWKRIRRRR